MLRVSQHSWPSQRFTTARLRRPTSVSTPLSTPSSATSAKAGTGRLEQFERVDEKGGVETPPFLFCGESTPGAVGARRPETFGVWLLRFGLGLEPAGDADAGDG